MLRLTCMGKRHNSPLVSFFILNFLLFILVIFEFLLVLIVLLGCWKLHELRTIKELKIVAKI